MNGIEAILSFVGMLVGTGVSYVVADRQAKANIEAQRIESETQLQLLEKQKALEVADQHAQLENQYLGALSPVFDVANKLIYRLDYYSCAKVNSPGYEAPHRPFDPNTLKEHNPDATPREYLVYLVFRLLGETHRYDLFEDGLADSDLHACFRFVWEQKVIPALSSSKIPGPCWVNRTVIDEIAMMVSAELVERHFSWIQFCAKVQADKTFAHWVGACGDAMTCDLAAQEIPVRAAARARFGILLVYLIDLIQDINGKPTYEEQRARAIAENLGSYWDRSHKSYRQWYLYETQDMSSKNPGWPGNSQPYRVINRKGNRMTWKPPGKAA